MAEIALEPPRLMTLDELAALGEDARVEIINGAVVRMAAAGVAHHVIASNIYRVLDAYVQANSIGAVFFDGLTYLMYSEAKGLKNSYIPDVSFLRNENLEALRDISRPHPGAPDLAVEVVSPDDKADDLQHKARIYLEKGTEQVWIVYPTGREVYQYHRDNDLEIHVYRGDEPMNVEALFPGLTLTLPMIFHLPMWAVK